MSARNDHIMTQTDEKIRLRNLLRDALLAATEQRDLRNEVIFAASGPEPWWVCYERVQMLNAVNQFRLERGRSLISMDAIVRVDQLATGHVDWLDKFSLYCAELVLAK